MVTRFCFLLSPRRTAGAERAAEKENLYENETQTPADAIDGPGLVRLPIDSAGGIANLAARNWKKSLPDCVCTPDEVLKVHWRIYATVLAIL